MIVLHALLLVAVLLWILGALACFFMSLHEFRDARRSLAEGTSLRDYHLKLRNSAARRLVYAPVWPVLVAVSVLTGLRSDLREAWILAHTPAKSD